MKQTEWILCPVCESKTRSRIREDTILLKSYFAAHRLSEYVWEEENRVSAMLSFGDTADAEPMSEK